MKSMRRARGSVISAGLIAVLALALLFVFDPLGSRMAMAEEESATETIADADLDLPAWMDVELVDALSGETFTIREMIGTPILLETYAVWCSTCLRQQQEMAKLEEMVGDRVLHISLNTDPNEGTEEVRAHAERYGFDWRFAVAPIEMTLMLVDEFTLTVVTAPQAPVLLIAEDGTTEFLHSGLKPATELVKILGLESVVSEDSES